MRRWVYAELPLVSGGEDSASAPLGGDARASQRMENVQVIGDGRVRQIPDWRLADTCKNLAGTPLESHAVCGGPFPFATQGGASAPSAGVAFSFNTTDNAIYLHQLGEDDTILRTFTAYSSYAESAPPQMTGFEWFGTFLYCAYGREAAASRRGLGVFNPTGAGTITNPTVSIVAGGAAAALLRFRGIAKHRGGTVLGWGYRSEETGSIDRPDILRWTKYVATDMTVDATWQPDLTPTSGGEVVVGTMGLAIVGCCEAGQYTVIGKESEVFVLDGDYNDQFNYRRIGSHGPVSTCGLTSTGPIGAWLANAGIAITEGGGEVRLITTNRLANRLATYYDLTYACATHDRTRTRLGWLLRRSQTMAGGALTEFWGSQVLWWDYIRDDFHIQDLPTTCFTIGTTNGPGISLAAPSGTVASITVSAVTSTSALVSWTHAGGDTSASIYLEYKKVSDSIYTVLGPLAPGTLSQSLTSLTAATDYSAPRVRYFKNGQYGSYATGSIFTTAAASLVGQPTTFAYTGGGSRIDSKGLTYWTAALSWVRQEYSGGSRTHVYQGFSASFAAATLQQDIASSTVSATFERVESSANVYYWVRHTLSDGTVGTETALTGHPIQYTASYLGGGA